MQTLTPFEFQARLHAGDQLLDVREAEELALAALPGALHIPLRQLPQRVGELNPQRPIAVLCHHGIRSEHAAAWLEQAGFSSVSHLGGGIEAWSLLLDPTVPRY